MANETAKQCAITEVYTETLGGAVSVDLSTNSFTKKQRKVQQRRPRKRVKV